MTTEILLGTANTLLFSLALFMGHEWWKSHKAQHKKLDESIKRLSEVYASKSAMYRAHKRLDEQEDMLMEHGERLTRIETMLDIEKKRDCACER